MKDFPDFPPLLTLCNFPYKFTKVIADFNRTLHPVRGTHLVRAPSGCCTMNSNPVTTVGPVIIEFR